MKHSAKIIRYHTSNGILRVWKLGLGDCGKVVIGLRGTIEGDYLVIEQYCNDQPSPDTFLIPRASISTNHAIQFLNHGELE